MDPGLILIILFLLAPLLDRLLKLGRPPQQPGEGQLPRQRMPRQRTPGEPAPRGLPGEEQEDRPFRSIPSADEEQEQSAATMLPDDLWEILTGEKRAPPEPAPQRQAPVPPPVAGRGEPGPGGATTTAGNQARTADRQRRESESRERDRLRDRERDPARVRSRERPGTPARERSLPPVTMRSPRDLQPAPRRHTPAAPPSSAADGYVRRVPVHEAPVVVSYETPPADADERYAQFQERRMRMAAPPTVERAKRSTEYAFKGPADLRRAFVMAEILGKPKGLDDTVAGPPRERSD